LNLVKRSVDVFLTFDFNFLYLCPIHHFKSIAGLLLEKSNLIAAFKAILFIPLDAGTFQTDKMVAFSVDIVSL
jgi:hypothetical protein